MATNLQNNTSDKIIEDILNETGNSQFNLICETDTVEASVQMDHVQVNCTSSLLHVENFCEKSV